MTQKINFQTLIIDFIALIFPNTCLHCDTALAKGETQICLTCQNSLPITDYHTYIENPLWKKFAGEFPVENAWAYLKFSKKSLTQKLLHQLKYKNNPEIGWLLGKWYGEIIAQKDIANNPIHCIVPIPLHPAKEQKRGYNQSEYFGKGLAESMQVPIITKNLIRIQYTETQTKKNKEERWKNVAEVFEVKNPEIFTDKHILLVDDVSTTGATLAAAAQNLFIQGKIKSLSIAVIAEAQ